MGKPTNTKSAGCSVTTSNCVVWQGPDLCCIDLCHGDTVSDVINEMAKKICTLFEILDVSSYDVSDLINGCPPANFVELLQLLIEQVNSIQTSGQNNSSTGGCPDCDIAVAACFQQQYGNVLSIAEYVSALGVKICDQQVIIQTQNNAIAQLTQQIANIQAQLNLLIGG